MAKTQIKGGFKTDTGKCRMDLIPPELLFAVGHILTWGCSKKKGYPERNWENGMHWSRPFGALMRHMWAWWGGAGPTSTSFLFGDLDPESKKSHLWHAGCCIAFLIAYEERGCYAEFDDRFTGPMVEPPADAESVRRPVRRRSRKR